MEVAAWNGVKVYVLGRELQIKTLQFNDRYFKGTKRLPRKKKKIINKRMNAKN